MTLAPHPTRITTNVPLAALAEMMDRTKAGEWGTADLTRVLFGDLLFADGFESGTTAAW